MHRLQDLVRLHRMGEKARSAAKKLSMGPNTARAYRAAIAAAGLLDGPADELPLMEDLRAAVEKHLPRQTAPQEESSIEAWRSEIEGLMTAGLAPRAIYDRLCQEHGHSIEGRSKFEGSYWAVKRMCGRLKRRRGVTPEQIAIAVETSPGEVAQVDFGEIGRLYDPAQRVMRRAWVFVMVLGFSRHMFAKVVFDQKTETWLELHDEAFRYLGGVPKVPVPDNLKAAVIRAAFGATEDPGLNRSYREFARHYGFKIDPTPAYAPKKKGKVESGVKYVKNNGLLGRDEEEIDRVNGALGRWVKEVAGRRIHGTTGQPPIVLFEEKERGTLLPLPTKRWDPVAWKRATVHQDVHLSVDGALYSAPWRLAGQKLWVRTTSASVEIYDLDENRVATHRRAKAGSRVTQDDHLPEGRRDLRHRSRGYWEERAGLLGPEIQAFIREVFDSDDVLYQLRAVQAIVALLEKYPEARARAACERARFFGNYTYQGVKKILTDALDLEPLPVAMIAATETAPSFRHARNLAELMAIKIEETHEPN